jgi:pimeloyl-ACP methyl ester carboxylesterase
MSLDEHLPPVRHSQLSAHGAQRVELPGPYGPIVALRTTSPAQAVAPRSTSPAPTVALLIPGYTGSKEDFAPLLDPMAAAGFEAVAIDLPGQYESPGPDDASAYLPAALGEVVAELVKLLTDGNRRVVLLGHSYGGLVARGAVLAGAPVTGLTLMDSGPRHLPDGVRRRALEIGEPLLRDNGIHAAYELREQVSSRAPGWAELPRALKDFYKTRFVSSHPLGLIGMAHALRAEPDLVHDLADELRTRRLPSSVVTGEFDDAWSVAEQKAMANQLNAPFSLIKAAGHSPNTENPAGLLEVLLAAWRGWLT